MFQCQASKTSHPTWLTISFLSSVRATWIQQANRQITQQTKDKIDLCVWLFHIQQAHKCNYKIDEKLSPAFCASSLFFFGCPLISAAVLLYIVALIAPNPAVVFAWDSLHTTSQNVVELLLYSAGKPSSLASVSGACVAAGLTVVRSVGCAACLSAEVSPAR